MELGSGRIDPGDQARQVRLSDSGTFHIDCSAVSRQLPMLDYGKHSLPRSIGFIVPTVSIQNRNFYVLVVYKRTLKILQRVSSVRLREECIYDVLEVNRACIWVL